MTETEERIFVDMYNDSLKDPEYAKHLKMAVKYGRRIMEILGPDGSIFLEYERAVCMAKGLRIEGAYRVGIKDGRPNKCLTCPTKCPTELLVI